jgi:hypothetical protein
VSNKKTNASKAPAAQAVARKRPSAKSAVVVQPAAKTATLAPAAKPVKAPKQRQKPVRDSFTMPENDFALIATLKTRLLAVKRETKKSELLRAGLHVLAALNTAALAAALGRLDPVKVGRPKQGH